MDRIMDRMMSPYGAARRSAALTAALAAAGAAAADVALVEVGLARSGTQSARVIVSHTSHKKDIPTNQI